MMSTLWYVYLAVIAAQCIVCRAAPTREERRGCSPLGFDLMTAVFMVLWPATLVVYLFVKAVRR
jgi:hypothetical protein